MGAVSYYESCKQINRIRLSLLNGGFAVVGLDWIGQVMNPVYSRLYYVKSGTARIDTVDGCMRMQAGHWYLLPAGCSFDYACDDTMEQIFFHIKLVDFDETDLLRTAGRPLVIEDAYDDYDMLVQRLCSHEVVDGLKIRQRIEDVVLTFVERYHIEINVDDYSPCIFNALNYIKQHLSVGLTISEVAENVFVSKSTLTKRFQKELSMSVNEYITDTIMFEALKLLLSTDMSILAVSEKFGFSDQFYFSRRFKTKFGKSPREFRKTMYI